MNALVVAPGPEYSVSDVHRGWCKGFAALGIDTHPYNLNDRLAFYTGAHMRQGDDFIPAFDSKNAVRLALIGLEAACYELDPDLVVFISGFFLDTRIIETMRSHGHAIVLVHTESPYEDDKQIAKAHLADLNVVNDPTNLGKFNAVAPTIYRPHSYDPDIHKPQPAVRGLESEFFFAGTGYVSRVEFFEAVDWSGIDAVFAGNWPSVTPESPLHPMLDATPGECLDNTDAVLRYASTLTSCNLYRVEADRPELSEGWSAGPREIELAACGRWFARQHRGESDALFPMLPTFSDPLELGDLIRWAIAHPEQREDAALKAREAVAAMTFDVSAAETLTALNL